MYYGESVLPLVSLKKSTPSYLYLILQVIKYPHIFYHYQIFIIAKVKSPNLYCSYSLKLKYLIRIH